MGYRERIEEAVVAMFNNDRKIDDVITVLQHPDAFSQVEGCCDIALDLLCIPKDNTKDFDYYKGPWPDGCFCRDYYYELWLCDAADGNEFLAKCYAAIKEFAEEGLVFDKPKQP